MKPDTSSKNFKISLTFFGVFILHLLLLRFYALNAVQSSEVVASSIFPLLLLGAVWISLASLFWYKSTDKQQTIIKHGLVFLISPIVLSPILAILYVIVVLFPLYDLVGSDF